MAEIESKKEMTFLEHLEELRWHLIRSAFAIFILATIAFIFKEIVFDVILMGPSQPDFPVNRGLCKFGREVLHTNRICINQDPIELQNIMMTGQFLAHIKISLIAGVVVAFPYIFFEIWRFIKPAMYNTEQKMARGAVLIISSLFFLGVGFGYFLICPLSVNFLIHYQVTELAENNIQLMSYVSLISSISLAAGILFELPVIIFFLSRVGLVTPQFLKKYRKHAVVVILILSAIITPPDIFSQILVAVPILVLYEVSIGISRRVNDRVREKREAEYES